MIKGDYNEYKLKSTKYIVRTIKHYLFLKGGIYGKE